MAGSLSRSHRGGPTVSLYWLAYVLGSVLILAVLILDPYFNKPSGWIALELFTKKPVRHGFDPCSWDYEGSWKIGSFSGPSPTALNISEAPLITCADVSSTSVSFVRTPFLHIPGSGEQLDPSKWTIFYEMRNLQTFNSEIGVSESRDGGATWQHVGIALADPQLPLSSPFVVYDAPTKLYVMLPDSSMHGSGRGGGGFRAFVTTAQEFPLGWRPLEPSWGHRDPVRMRRILAGEATGPSHGGQAVNTAWRRLGADPDRVTHGSSSDDWDSDDVNADDSWGPPDHNIRFNGTTAVFVDGRWWIFTSIIQPSMLPWRSPRATPFIYTAKGSLLSKWFPHPAAGRQPSVAGCTSAPGAATAAAAGGMEGPLFSAGRPFVWQGSIHRWVRGCKRHRTDELTLLRATVANATHFEEEVAATYTPGDDRSWHSQRIGFVDVQPRPGTVGQWWGALSGDRYADGMHHFVVHELWFVEIKASLRDLMAAQLAVVLVVVALHSAAGGQRADSSSGSRGRHAAGTSGGDGGSDAAADSGCCRHDATLRQCVVQLLSRHPAVLSRVIGAAELAARWSHAGVARIGAVWEVLEIGARRAAAQPRVQFFAHASGACAMGLVVAAAVMLAVPSAVPCPRWMVVVRPFTSPPHYLPQQPFVDPAGPFDVSNLTIVSGCTMSFMDRLENMVGSLQYWEPHTPIVLYDLGFTSEQLAQIRCWRGVQVVRFPYEDYPPHVREISNYAFKPLVFDLAVKRYPVMLWLDCGLEVRAPLDPMRAVLARDGHVSAQQSGAPVNYLYTEMYSVPFFKLSEQEYDRIKNLPFCAGGLQGFVRGAASERLILGPAVACAMEINCTSPPGHSRSNHFYDQTSLTLYIRLNNYSSCLPREQFCTSAVKKLSWDPTASSAPIVMASRRHRWPKPYQHRVATAPAGCSPDPASNPWRSISSEHPETVTKSSSLLFKISFVYGQAAGDFIVQASCCLGFHLVAQGVLVAALLAGELRRRLLLPRGPKGVQSIFLSSTAAGGGGGGGGVGGSGGASQGAGDWGWGWGYRPSQLIGGLVLLVLLLVVSMTTSCRAI
ncbi:hypothetical protein VaNZ11_015809 [Volvox africanus]|uniref:Glucosamine inositolphosphorylceramide transferase 1 N-terminal domain-containing protein n=1 Tax=Volvox africanus TaxID=51714 RepID=A0ABQ5SMN4_9CHLO|nr:hypothetical protein VaNZ11_015809 [Volvox africanus]